MAKKKESGSFILPLLLAAGAGYLLLSSNNSGNTITTREQALKVILHFNPNADTNTLQTADLNYVIARATAYQAAQPFYAYNGVRYITSTGRAA